VVSEVNLEVAWEATVTLFVLLGVGLIIRWIGNVAVTSLERRRER